MKACAAVNIVVEASFDTPGHGVWTNIASHVEKELPRHDEWINGWD
jgi:hypothetical protein